MNNRQLYGISIEELKKIVERAEHAKQFDCMEGSIYFEVIGDTLRIKQYCVYHDCNSNYYKDLKNEA